MVGQSGYRSWGGTDDLRRGLGKNRDGYPRECSTVPDPTTLYRPPGMTLECALSPSMADFVWFCVVYSLAIIEMDVTWYRQFQAAKKRGDGPDGSGPFIEIIFVTK